MLPSLLTSRLRKILDIDYPTVINALTHERQGSLRINTLKGDAMDIIAEFAEK